MKYLYIFTVLFSSSLVFSQDVNERLAVLEERLDDFELDQALKKFTLSGSFFNQYESYHSVKTRTDLLNNVPTSIKNQIQGDDRDIYLSLFFMRAELNFDAKVSSTVNFYSTLGMTKFWNVAGRDGRNEAYENSYKSLVGGYGFRDSAARFDVAYVNYRPANSSWSFSVGRMTTNNGPPQNQLDGLGRTGTYPFLSYNVILDGAAVVYNIDNLPKDHKLNFRVFYTPFQNVSNNDFNSNRVDTNVSSNNELNSNESVDSKGNSITLLTEYSLKNLSFAKKLDVFHSLYTFDRYYNSQFQGFDSSVAGCGNPGFEDFCNEGVEYGRANASTLYVGLERILNTGLSLSLTYNVSEYTLSDRELEYGENYLLTGNYKFDNKFNGGDLAGFEYIKTDESKIPVDVNSLYLSDFYSITDGEGVHLYYTKQIGSNQVLRFGYFKFREGDSLVVYDDTTGDVSSTYLRWKVFF